MIRARRLRAALASLVALCSLVVVASAGAAAWQGPVLISTPLTTASDSPLISLGASGDAAAGWWDATSSQVVLARKRAGGAWSAPVPVGPSGAPVFVFVGVDGSGTVTAVFNGATGVTLATWAAAAAAPTLTTLTPPLGGTLTIDDLAVDAAGDAVLVGTTATQLVIGYRQGAAGAFALQQTTPPDRNPPDPMNPLVATNPRVAINPAGTAVVVYRDNFNGLWGTTRTTAVGWTTPESLTMKTVLDIVPTVGIDGGGAYLTAFTYDNGTAVVVRSVLRSPGAGPQESTDLSADAAMAMADQVEVVVNPTGAALLVWKQTGAALADSSVRARFGTTGTGWGAIETVNDAGADTPVAAIGNDGRCAVAWEREGGVTNTGQARIRTAGAAGTWGDIRNINTQHANYTKPSIATDGRGDFATATAPADGVSQPVSISAYDVAAPAVSTVALSGTLLAGDAVGMSVTVSDEWSAVGTPTWTFGDGTTGTGLAVSHTYAVSGTYVAHVSVSDSSANTSGTDVTISITAAQSTLTIAKFSARWKRSRVSGTLTVAGTAPRAGKYDIDATKGKVKFHASLQLPVGGFSRSLKLPAKLVPGSYRVKLTPTMPEVKPAAQDARLSAPPEGVVDEAWMSSTRGGAPALTLVRATKLWAIFRYASLPKGQVEVTWYKLGKKRKLIGASLKARAPKVAGSIGPGKFAGRYQAVLTYKGVVVAQVSVKVTS